MLREFWQLLNVVAELICMALTLVFMMLALRHYWRGDIDSSTFLLTWATLTVAISIRANMVTRDRSS